MSNKKWMHSEYRIYNSHKEFNNNIKNLFITSKYTYAENEFQS